jgi:hypothetical protein
MALSFDEASALLASIPEGSKIVVSGHQNDKPFTEEGVLVKDKDGSYLLRRQRGIFVAFFGPNITYDSITAKREQSVPPARRAQIIERQLEEEAEGDTLLRHRKPPQQRTTRYVDLDSEDDVHRPPAPPPQSTPPPTQTALTEEGMMRIMRVMLAAQTPLRSTDALPPPPPPAVSMLDDEDTRMARLFRAVGQGMQGEVKASWTLVPDALEIASQVDDNLRVFSVIHYVKLGLSVDRWATDWSTSLHEFRGRDRDEPKGGSKPLIVEAIALRQRNAARVFKAQLARCLRDGLPRGGKEEFFEVLHVGVALMDIVATRVAEGFGTGGAVVLTRFNAQLKKGIIDIDALWPRGTTRPFRD